MTIPEVVADRIIYDIKEILSLLIVSTTCWVVSCPKINLYKN